MGTNAVASTPVSEAPGNPDVADVLQETHPVPAVAVKPVGPVTTHELPSRIGAAFTTPLTTASSHVLGPDEKRKRTILCADVDWLYSRSGSGANVPWYAKVPLILTHCDAVYAQVPSSTGTLSVITETWAD